MSDKTHIYRAILLFDNYCLSSPIASLIAAHSSDCLHQQWTVINDSG